MKIIKQFRKSISLQLSPSGEIVVKAPKFMKDSLVHTFITKHKDWITERQMKILQNKKKFIPGEKFYLFGDLFSLVLSNNLKSEALYFNEENFLIASSSEEHIKQAFMSFYKKGAKEYIAARVYEIAAILQVHFYRLRITSAKTRWGSCSSKKNINFSWRLMMVPKPLIDYVIIHELAHLKEMNHSKKFWNLVENYYTILGKGNYKADVKALKQYSLDTNF